jgi:hypothetical protein
MAQKLKLIVRENLNLTLIMTTKRHNVIWRDIFG